MTFLSAIKVSWAEETPETRSFTTRTGRTYEDAQVIKVEPSALTIRHQNGMARLSFADLPESVREEYHYNAEEASRYEAERQANIQLVIHRLETEAAQMRAAEERERMAREEYESALARGAWVIGRVKVADGYLLVLPDKSLHSNEYSRSHRHAEQFLSQFLARPLLPSTQEIYVHLSEPQNIADCEEAVIYVTPSDPGLVTTEDKTYRAFQLMALKSTSGLSGVK